MPVFPLPGLVLFPHALLALHVFELRYRTMVREALSGERSLAIAMLKPGWERDYHGSPEFHELGTLARFEDVEWLPDDCYDLHLRGVQRVRFGRQVREFPYRCCVVEAVEQPPYGEDDPLTQMARQSLIEHCQRMLPLGAEVWLSPPAHAADATYETVVHTIAQALRLPGEEKLALLATDSVIERGRRLLECMRRATSGRTPPARPERGDRN